MILRRVLNQVKLDDGQGKPSRELVESFNLGVERALRRSR